MNIFILFSHFVSIFELLLLRNGLEHPVYVRQVYTQRNLERILLN